VGSAGWARDRPAAYFRSSIPSASSRSVDKAAAVSAKEDRRGRGVDAARGHTGTATWLASTKEEKDYPLNTGTEI